MINDIKNKIMCTLWLDKSDVDFIDNVLLDSNNIDENMRQIGDIVLNARQNRRFRHTK